MEKKINIAELLKSCPSGMELDCTMYENVYFDKIYNEEDCLYPIGCYIIGDNNRNSVNFTKYGGFNYHSNAKCVIFPKGKTTWEEFVPPCKFKDGDVIFTHANSLKVGLGNTWISIYKENRNGGVATYVDYAEDRSDYYYSDLDGDKAFLCMESDILYQRLATEEEKQKLFDAIKVNGYKWNAETKTLEKLVEPKFKVGDRIRHKTCIRQENIVTEIKDNNYILDDELALTFISQDEYELVPTKFDINTLKPFESRVLVRNYNSDYWKPAIFGFSGKDKNVPFCVEGGNFFNKCIPYEGNEHLLGTTKDCDEYYKLGNK